jgi:UDP:flavonoid glycosyltransferase YjiC (YdhE family)
VRRAPNAGERGEREAVRAERAAVSLRSMRMLFASSLGGLGHLEPVVTVAQAAGRVGHEVLVIVPPSLVAAVKRAGLDCVVGDEPPSSFVDEVWAKVRAGPPERVAGLIDRELFAERCTQAMLVGVRAVRDSWRPDVIMREPCEYASAIAAHEAGIAQVEIGISLAAIERAVLDMVTPIIEGFCAGVATAIATAPYLTSFPAALDPSPWPDTRRFRRPERAARPLPDWWPGDEWPLLYVTFGSVLGHLPEAARVYQAALEAVSGLAARVLLTVGRGIDPGRLGPVPDNTHVERWVPQSDVLAHAAVVVCHGGSGTTFGALSAGVPVVIRPLFADQSMNGRVVESEGCGLVVRGRDLAVGELRGLGPSDVAPLRDAIERVLDEPAYRAAAHRVAADLAAEPTPDQLIKQLAAGGNSLPG